MNTRLSDSKYTTTDLWLRKGFNPPKPVRNKITNRSIQPACINDQDKANERNYRPRFLKSNPRPYVPMFGDEQQEVATQQEQQSDTSQKVEELMSLIDDNKVQESDFVLLVDAARQLSGPEQIMLNRRLFESASAGAQKMLQILNPAAEPGAAKKKAPSRGLSESERKLKYIGIDDKRKKRKPIKLKVDKQKMRERKDDGLQ